MYEESKVTYEVTKGSMNIDEAGLVEILQSAGYKIGGTVELSVTVQKCGPSHDDSGSMEYYPVKYDSVRCIHLVWHNSRRVETNECGVSLNVAGTRISCWEPADHDGPHRGDGWTWGVDTAPRPSKSVTVAVPPPAAEDDDEEVRLHRHQLICPLARGHNGPCIFRKGQVKLHSWCSRNPNEFQFLVYLCHKYNTGKVTDIEVIEAAKSLVDSMKEED